MPPMTSLTFYLAQGFVIFGKNARPEKTPSKLSIKAKYSYAGRQVEEITNIDLLPYLNSTKEPIPILDNSKA